MLYRFESCRSHKFIIMRKENKIISLIRDEYRVRESDFFSDTRKAHVLESIQCACFILKNNGFSVEEIAQIVRITNSKTYSSIQSYSRLLSPKVSDTKRKYNNILSKFNDEYGQSIRYFSNFANSPIETIKIDNYKDLHEMSKLVVKLLKQKSL